MGKNLLGLSTPGIHDSKHLSSFPTLVITSTGDYRTFPLMPLNPLAPAFLPRYQSSSDPPVLLCNSTTTSLTLAPISCGTPPQIIPSHAPPLNQPITGSTFILPLTQQKNPPKQDVTARQPSPGSVCLLSSTLQHQGNYLQAIHKTIQQFNQNLKAEQLDRKTHPTYCPSTSE